MPITLTFDTVEEMTAAAIAHGVSLISTPLDGGPLDPGTVEWILEVLATLNPSEVEDRALDAVPPGAGAGSTTAAVIAECVELIKQAADAR